jgi:hypothetical protein
MNSKLMISSLKKYSELPIVATFSVAVYPNAFWMEGSIGFILLKKASNQAIMVTLNLKNQ